METCPVRSVCGVILVTQDVDRLASFYRDVLELPVEREEHGDLPAHYGVDLGTTHLGIHPPESFNCLVRSGGSSVVALQVANLKDSLNRLGARGVHPVVAEHDEGFGPLAVIRDPDGNLIELVELTYNFQESA